MDNEDKAKELANDITEYGGKWVSDEEVIEGCMQMAQWKDKQYKTAYVVTRSEEHCYYVEKVFFDKEKAEEYCRPFNEDENSYHRDITKIEVSL